MFKIVIIYSLFFLFLIYPTKLKILTYKYSIDTGNTNTRLSRWSRGLRRVSIATVLLGLWVRIPQWT